MPKVREKVFDPTESSGVGLLDEMSYNEMKERLNLNKSRTTEHVQNKRSEIVKMKQEKEEGMKHRMEAIAKVRAASKHSNQKSRCELFCLYIIKRKIWII